jgi:hypothetical protein
MVLVLRMVQLTGVSAGRMVMTNKPSGRIYRWQVEPAEWHLIIYCLVGAQNYSQKGAPSSWRLLGGAIILSLGGTISSTHIALNGGWPTSGVRQALTLRTKGYLPSYLNYLRLYESIKVQSNFDETSMNFDELRWTSTNFDELPVELSAGLSDENTIISGIMNNLRLRTSHELPAGLSEENTLNINIGLEKQNESSFQKVWVEVYYLPPNMIFVP